MKYRIKETDIKFQGKKTKGHSTIQSLDRIIRDVNSKKYFIDKKEYDHMISVFRKEFVEVNLEFDSDKEPHKKENFPMLEIEKPKQIDKLTEIIEIQKNDKEENRIDNLKNKKISTENFNSENFSAEKIMNYNNSTHNLLKNKSIINQNFYFYSKIIFDKFILDNHKPCKTIDHLLLNNKTDFCTESYKEFLNNLKEKISETFTLENQIHNFIDYNKQQINNPFPNLLKNINDFVIII